MKPIQYTFSVIRYVHDPAAGEMLNIGVVLCAGEIAYIDVMLEFRYERLSSTFLDFDGEHYKRVLRQLHSAITNTSKRAAGSLFALQEPLTDVDMLISIIMPDRDLSIQFGHMLAGIAEDPAQELKHIFERMVASQFESTKIQKRTDEEVWQSYQKSLTRQRITPYLKPKTFTSEDYDLKFDHAFKNERWHVLQPVSLDYARPEGLQTRATQLLGAATALEGNPEVGKLYILLGPPKKNEHRTAYKRAKHLLDRIPIEHELIEENQADRFAKELASYMREHGVTEDKTE
jgi:hypothetical protein